MKHWWSKGAASWWRRCGPNRVMGNLGYSVVADWDETGSLFVATVPALTVCTYGETTYGETKEEAMAKVKEPKPATIVGLKHLRQPIPRGIP